jgi:hypothetical protein
MQRLDHLRRLVRPFVMKVAASFRRAKKGGGVTLSVPLQIHPDKHHGDPQAAQLNSSSLQASFSS